MKQIKWVVSFLIALAISSALTSALATEPWDDDCVRVNLIGLCQLQ